MKNKIILIICGYISHLSISSITQDIIGKERYIEWVNNNWIESSKTIPLALSMLICATIYIVYILVNKE